MSLQKSYLNFLNSPRAAVLSNRETQFHYITTGHSVAGETIIDHLNKQKHQLEKKVEKVISAIETLDSLVLETETTIEFKTGGGSFLPGLDDNFLIDQKATFPLVCPLLTPPVKCIQKSKQSTDSPKDSHCEL